MDLKEEQILGDSIYGHWYYVSKGRALCAFLGGIRANEVLDVGAGSGIFSKTLLDSGIVKGAICVDPYYKEDRSVGHNGKPITFLRGVKSVPQNLVLMMDVLEHVDDDAALLKQYLPQKGGYVLITVPAFRFLWSGHDVFLEHKRRYTAAGIEDAARRAGLEVVKTRYFFGLLFPAIAAIRTLKRARHAPAKSDLKPCPAWLNRALIFIHDFERKTLFPLNKLAGLSVFCLCRRT